jgi:hypothetical protein
MFQVSNFDFTSWYSSLPFPAQVGVGIAGLMIAILAIILAVYIIKYTILAVYYIIKGIVKGTVWIIKKIFGLPRTKAVAQVNPVEQSPFTAKTPATLGQYNVTASVPAAAPRFCAHCGARVDTNVLARVAEGQATFCANCGSPLAPESVSPATQVV